jgi:hypothetical protein
LLHTLEFAHDILHISGAEWDLVASRQTVFHTELVRTGYQLKKKINKLCRAMIPTGNPNIPPTVREANEIRGLLRRLPVPPDPMRNYSLPMMLLKTCSKKILLKKKKEVMKMRGDQEEEVRDEYYLFKIIIIYVKHSVRIIKCLLRILIRNNNNNKNNYNNINHYFRDSFLPHIPSLWTYCMALLMSTRQSKYFFRERVLLQEQTAAIRSLMISWSRKDKQSNNAQRCVQGDLHAELTQQNLYGNL